MFFSACFRALSAGKKTALAAVFVALSVVVNCFSIDVGTSNKTDFTYAVCFYAGYLLGAVPAFFVAFLGDALGYLLNPQGVFWLFGVTLGVYAVIMGAVMNAPLGRGRGAPYLRAVVALVLGYVLVTVVLNSVVNYWYARIFFWDGIPKKTFLVYLGGRLAFQSIVYAVNFAVCLALLPAAVGFSRRGRKGSRAAPHEDVR